MDDLIDELTNISDSDEGPEYLNIKNKNHNPLLLDKNNFHGIVSDDVDKNDYKNENFSNLLFVDGGSCTVFEGAEFCLGLIRTVAVLYSGNVRKNIFKKEFYVIVKNNEQFVVKTFPKNDFDNIKFDSSILSANGSENKCSTIIGVVRRLAELQFAYEINDGLNVDAKIILDGTLECRYPYERFYLDKLTNVSALSKTCSLVTTKGFSVIKRLLDLNNSGEWYYRPIVDANAFSVLMFFVKLNKNSDYVFRFETKCFEKNVYEKIILALKNNSVDPIFLGYPYGFIDVDSHARISEEEKKMIQTRFVAKIGKKWGAFSKSLKSMNAHDVLDSIKF